MSTAGARRQSKQERMYAILRSRILEGRYGPGHRLVIEAIGRELNVSPMPVREAIRRLEAEGWVVYHANQGARVAPLDDTSWVEIMTTLAILEGYATATAAPLLSKGDVARMRDANERMHAAMQRLDALDAADHNQAFHGVLYDRCPNGYVRGRIAATLDLLATMRRTIFTYILPIRGSISIQEHENLVVMIESGADARAIEDFAREHKLHTVRAYEELRAEGGHLGN